MANKQAIIDNVDMYSAVELADYIKKGVVSYEELCDEAGEYFPPRVRKEVQSLIQDSEKDDWKLALQSGSVELFENYLKKYPKGLHRQEARNLIDKISQEGNDSNSSFDDDSVWNCVDKNSIEKLKEFINTYPESINAVEARKLINKLKGEGLIGFDTKALIKRIKSIQSDNLVIRKDVEITNLITDFLKRKKIKHQDLLDAIKEDYNLLQASVVRNLLESGVLTYDDLESIEINRNFIQKLANGDTIQTFSPPAYKLKKINKQCTEVYFWGIPSSGKSCAIGAILNVAGNGKVAKSMDRDNDCQGYGYMSDLPALFNNNGEVGTLPEGTPTLSTYEMGFDLEDQKGRMHPITFIDLAGELVRCMWKNDAGIELSDAETEVLDTLTNILIDNRSNNRKIHFFVLEYGAEDRLYEGRTQDVYLNGALKYIERTQIFKKDTDAIYLMISKADKAKHLSGDIRTILETYIQDHYLGFYNGLVRICKKNEINNGEVKRISFSLGKVCFQDFCLFNEDPASNVVKILLERTACYKSGKLGKLERMLKL